MDPQVPGKYQPKPNEPVTSDAHKEPHSEETFRRVYQYEPETRPRLSERIKKATKCSTETVTSSLPIIKWLPQYKLEHLLPDAISGLTVAVMHIPQGMAYAVLGGVPAVVGIYMALFPVFVYILMGTSPHVSMGTFAVVSMMVGKSVYSIVGDDMDNPFTDDAENATVALTPIQAATAVCFAVGIWQFLLGILRLGSLSVFLSATLISGFTTGAAVHVFTSQVSGLLGLSIQRFSGPLKIIYTYYAIFSNIHNSNYIAVVMSGCTILILGLYNELGKPFLLKKFKRNIPFPAELTIVIIGTILSSYFDLKEQHNISIVDNVPTGLPMPSVPPLQVLPDVLVDGLVIGIVAITVNISMANIFAKKHGYEIDGNQEILASGVGNIFGSFFSCMPYAVSLSRSLIQQSAGAKTQIANVVSCIVLVIVLLFIAPFFEPLPYCVLSAVIVVALKGMFLQFKDLVRIMKLSKLDGFVWLAVFLGVVVLDIDYGLGIGVMASIGAIIYQTQHPVVSVLGRIPGTQIYKDRKLYRKAQSPEGVLILEVIGCLNFANAETLRKKILGEILDAKTRSIVLVQDTGKPVPPLNVILKMTSVPYMDPSAVQCLERMCGDLAKMNSACLLCECVPSVYDALQGCDFFANFPAALVFPTVHHAIDYLERFEVQCASNRTIFQIA